MSWKCNNAISLVSTEIAGYAGNVKGHQFAFMWHHCGQCYLVNS
jgi:hypothetical protein